VNVAAAPVEARVTGALPAPDAGTRAAPRAAAAAPAIVATTDIARTDATAVAHPMPVDAAMPSLGPAEPRQAAPEPARDARAALTGTMPALQVPTADDRPLVAALAAKDTAALPTPTPPATTGAAPVAEAAPPAYAQHAATSPLAAAATITIDVPVHDAQWPEQVAERIVTLVARGTERAELRVSPPELGPVEVRIDVKGGEATVAIIAAQPATRDALESALPLLRDLLAQQGLALGEATVRDGRADADGRPRDDSPATPGNAAVAAADEASTVRTGVRRLIDVFA
jgi:flagellar hook-length control protein FliK